MQSVEVEAGKMNGQQMDALLRRFERPLLQYATRILGDSDRARDVVQETFVKLQNEKRSSSTRRRRNGFSRSAATAPSTFAEKKSG